MLKEVFYLDKLSILASHFVFGINDPLWQTWIYNISETCSHNIGDLSRLHFISLKAFCCSFLHINCLPFLVKLYICFSNFCNFGKNTLRKFTIPAKLLQPFGVIGSCNICMASNLLLKGLMQTFMSFINITFPFHLLGYYLCFDTY